MTSNLAWAAVLAAAPLFAQNSIMFEDAVRIAPRQFHPIHEKVDHFDGTAESTNWSGYAVLGSGFTSAQASWTVPAAVCTGVKGNQYSALPEYAHKVIDHAEAYVDGNVHTNRIENFSILLKRAIQRTYMSIEPFHLFRYLDEQCFRYNEQKLTDRERFRRVLKSVAGSV